MSEPAPTLPVGTVVAGKLRILRTLGVGGMGTVYEVEHELTRHRRALKLLHPEFASNAHVVARFLREASAAGRIGSPHIVETFDAGSLETGEPYLVMELLDGQSLGAILDEVGRVSERDALAWLTQACDGVQAAHAAGIIHRDIKPDNLFVERTGRVKILDFGISKFDPRLTGEHQLTGDLTLGTPFYMAPEQTSKTSSVDARADVYALGVVLYEAVTGKKPFEAETYPQLIVQIHEGDYEPASSIVASSTLLDDIIAKAMAREPAQRFQSAAELASALRELAVATERAAAAPAKSAVAGQAPFAVTRPAGDLESILRRHREPRVELAATERKPETARPVAAEQLSPATPAAPARSDRERTLLSASEPPPSAAERRRAGAWPLLLVAVVVLGGAAAWWARAARAGLSDAPIAAVKSVAVVSPPSEPQPAETAPSPSAPPLVASSAPASPRAPVRPKSSSVAPDNRAQQHELEQSNPFK
jgi:eukaryotic-like serine/threonine-protein kinase